MKITLFFAGALLVAATQFAPLASAQQVDGSDIDGQLTNRETKINKLTIEEQLQLRAAQQKAVEDPAVKAALAKRDEAIEGFRKALHDSMVKSDPKIEAILQKVAVGNSPGF
jgi:Spy/CpxP family protein refolding chaperone